MDSFEWIPTESADERHPMQLISGQLHCSGGERVRIPAGKIVNNGWGEIGSRHLVGEPRKPVPERLTLAWFSYIEDQFFAGELELPQAELTKLFRAGFRDPLTRQLMNWSKIIVGMGLGGWACVWLAGHGHVRAIASAKLEPAALDWAEVLDNPEIERSDFIRSKLRARLSDLELKALAERGPPAPPWPRDSRPYPWRIHVGGVQVPLHMCLRSFNGERCSYDFARQPPELLDKVPKRMDITWLTRAGWKLLTKISLDEREVFDAFDRAAASGPDPATLQLELGPRSQVSLTVEHREGKIPLTRSSVELLRLGG